MPTKQELLYQKVLMEKECPRCGGAVEDLDKDTGSGRDIRYYRCAQCGWSDFIDVGVALWKAYAEAAQDDKS